MTVECAQESLRRWFVEAGNRKISSLLDCAVDWPDRGTPTPSHLCQHPVCLLAIAFAAGDPRVHPLYIRLVAAVMAEHSDESYSVRLVFGSRRVDVKAMLPAASIVQVSVKYRELFKYPNNTVQVRRSATISQ